jgi:hypothetical protein
LEGLAKLGSTLHHHPPETSRKTMYSNFLLGKLKVTDAARDKLQRTPLDLVARHAVGDHGLVSAMTLKKNQAAMSTADAIISCYHIDPTNPAAGRVLVITGECWESTTVKLESEA